MGIEEELHGRVEGAARDLVAAGVLPAAVLDARFVVERAKRADHGDLTTNAALAWQRAASKPPREIAASLAERLARDPDVRSVDVAGPGFLNLRLSAAPFHRVLTEIARAGRGYGRPPAAIGERIQVEFVSANPTGPLLVSHGRGAVVGDAVARLLEATGHRVVREYYVNDYGNQVRLLAESVRAAARGEPQPEGGYGGEYVRELARWVQSTAPGAFDDLGRLTRLCVGRVLDGVPGSTLLPGIKKTLAALGVHHDVWFSEESLHRYGRVAAALAELEACGMLEERDGALFFKSDATDDKDRVVRKQDGTTTYFASDIAYHADKVARGFDRLIVVLGADHHGYVARVRGALGALGLPKDRFEPILLQLVHLLRDGKPYKMGKRLGTLVTIEEIVDEIDEAAHRRGAGADALRYFYLARRADTTVELDVELAKKTSLDNPVFYLQMGHARLCSILRRARAVFGLAVPRPAPALIERVVHPDELSIVASLGRFPAVLAEAAAGREPHRIVFFLQELAQAFHSYFTRLRGEGDAVLPLGAQMALPDWEARWDRDKTLGRLVWVDAIRGVYAAGLELCGITALERMDRLPGPVEEAGAAEELGGVA